MKNRTLSVLVCVILLPACEVERGSAGGSDSQPEQETRVVEAMPDAPARSVPENGRSLEEHLRDASLGAQVKLAFADESQLRLLELEPEIRDGVVLLKGQAPSAEHYRLAEQVARGVQGVRGVRNEIEAPGVEPAELAASGTADPVDTIATQADQNPNTPTADPAARSADPVLEAPAEQESEARYHVVASGESLWEIARANGTSIDALKRANNLQGDRLRPGQRLRLP